MTTKLYVQSPRPARSELAASRDAFIALLLRDLVVLKKNLGIFITRTIIQPFLMVFVFLYVFPQIGEGIGGNSEGGLSAFATVLVAGLIGLSIMFQGIQAVAMPLANEFGYTKEIEDRVSGTTPCIARGYRQGRCRGYPGSYRSSDCISHRRNCACQGSQPKPYSYIGQS